MRDTRTGSMFLFGFCCWMIKSVTMLTTGVNSVMSFQIQRQHRLQLRTKSSSSALSWGLVNVWIEDAEPDFVDPEENLEEGEVCWKTVKAFADDPDDMDHDRYLAAGALVERAYPSNIVDAWTADAIPTRSRTTSRRHRRRSSSSRSEDADERKRRKQQQQRDELVEMTIASFWEKEEADEEFYDDDDDDDDYCDVIGPNLQVQGTLQILDDLFLYHLRQYPRDVKALQTFVVQCGTPDSEYTCSSYMAAVLRGFKPLRQVLEDEDSHWENEDLYWGCYPDDDDDEDDRIRSSDYPTQITTSSNKYSGIYHTIDRDTEDLDSMVFDYETGLRRYQYAASEDSEWSHVAQLILDLLPDPESMEMASFYGGSSSSSSSSSADSGTMTEELSSTAYHGSNNNGGVRQSNSMYGYDDALPAMFNVMEEEAGDEVSRPLFDTQQLGGTGGGGGAESSSYYSDMDEDSIHDSEGGWY